MGDFVTNPDSELFEDKTPAPGLSLRAGWTENNVLSAADANALKNACNDLRDAVLDLEADVADGVSDPRIQTTPAASKVPLADGTGKISSSWLAADQAAATASLRTLGTSSTQAAAGDDSRFATPTNATATPTASKIPIANGSGKLDSWVTSGAVAGTASLRTLGTGATDACAGNDSRLSTPSNATATPTASKIPIADGSGKLDVGWIPSAATAATPSIALATAALPATLNLSSEGTIDWFHIYSLTTNPSPYSATANVHRKIRGEGDMFRTFLWFPSPSGGGTLTNGDLDFPCTTTSGDDSSAISAYENGTYIFPTGNATGHGFGFWVKGSRVQRVLRVYMGRNACDVTCYAALNDFASGSTPATTQTLSIPKATGTPTVFQLGQKVTVTFTAAYEGQWLWVEFKSTTGYSAANTVNFMGATLALS